MSSLQRADIRKLNLSEEDYKSVDKFMRLLRESQVTRNADKKIIAVSPDVNYLVISQPDLKRTYATCMEIVEGLGLTEKQESATKSALKRAMFGLTGIEATGIDSFCYWMLRDAGAPFFEFIRNAE